jgi:CubicO group peptidase (beta-lactamase class C family)
VGTALKTSLISDVSDPVTRYLSGLRGTAYDGPSINDLLSMSSGVGGTEDWNDPASSINAFAANVFSGGSLQDIVRAAQRVTEPGTTFNYSTLDAQVLGWVVEAATGRTLADYASRAVWRKIGAERDAYYWLTRRYPRTAIGGGSFNAAARDVARLGLLMSRNGCVSASQILPTEWITRSRETDATYLAVGALGSSGLPHYGYSNLWWTLGDPHRSYTGIGVYGQYLYVDPDADVVIVKLSAWPQPDDHNLDRETICVFQTLVEQLEQRDDSEQGRLG